MIMIENFVLIRLLKTGVRDYQGKNDQHKTQENAQETENAQEIRYSEEMETVQVAICLLLESTSALTRFRTM